MLTLALVCLLLTGSVTVTVAGDSNWTGHTPDHDTLTPAAVGSPTQPVSALAAGQASVSGLQEPPDADATVTQITVQPDGAAVWSLTIRMSLDSDQAEAEFAAFREEFASNRSEFVDDYRTTMVDAVSEAANLTQREMRATDFEAETGTEAVPRERGFVTYRFRWEGFAPVDDGTISVGDTFEDGLFLEENSLLIIRMPDGYESTAVEPDPDQVASNELRWEGPVQFGDERPSVEFVQSDSTDDSTDGTDSTDDQSNGTDSTDDQGGDSGGALPGSVLFGTAGVAVLAGVAALYLHRRRQEPDPKESPAGLATDDETGPDTAETRQERTDPGEVPELATDEDRVVATLKAEGGRMRQSDLADQLDWSPSKTSRVLSDMADEGEIEKLRIGRENVIDRVDENGTES